MNTMSFAGGECPKCGAKVIEIKIAGICPGCHAPVPAHLNFQGEYVLDEHLGLMGSCRGSGRSIESSNVREV
jgi:hypothetical protein